MRVKSLALLIYSIHYIIAFLYGILGVSVTTPNKEESMPLHIASFSGHVDIVELLIQAGILPHLCPENITLRLILTLNLTSTFSRSHLNNRQ
jgi:ankyrin repeat protein